MQRLRDELLARAALAVHQDGQIGLGHLVDRLEHASHGGARAGHGPQAVLAGHAVEQQAVLALEPRALEGPLDDHPHLVVVERLGDVVVGPGFHGLHGELLAAVGRHQDDGRTRLHPTRSLEHVQAGLAAAEREIDQHQIAGLARQRLDGLVRPSGQGDLVPLLVEEPLDRDADRGFVVDHQHPGLHRPPRSATGKVATISVPRPTSEVTSMDPPCASTTLRTMARPRPVPPARVV